MENLFNQLRTSWHFRGNVSYLLVMLVLVSLVVWQIHTNVLIQYFEQDKTALFIELSIFWLATISSWLYWRRIPKFKDGEIGILLAPRRNANLGEVLEQLHYELSKKFKQDNHLADVKCHLFPYNVQINNSEDASRIIKASGARVLVFGGFREGNIAGKKHTGFQEISFTFRHKASDQGELDYAKEAAAEAILHNMYSYEEDNSFIHFNEVVNNICDVSSFLIAIGFTLEGKYQKSLPALRHLKYKAIAPKRNPSFEAAINKALVHTLERESERLYELVVDEITQPSADKVFDDIEQIIIEARKINSDKTKYNLTFAVVYFHRGDLNKARSVIIRLENRFVRKKKDASVSLSLGFLYLWEREYDRAFRKFQTIERYDLSLADSVFYNVLRFLDALILIYPSKPELYFETAFLNDMYQDVWKAQAEYKHFIEHSCNDGEGVDLMKTYAENRLGELSLVESQ